MDDTAGVKRLLRRVTVEELKDHAIWRQLAVLVEVLPDDDVFPVRTQYQPAESGTEASSYNIGVNRLTSPRPLFFTLHDCIASKLLTGRAPKVVRAIRFKPGPRQRGLVPLKLLGKDEYCVDPNTQDVYKVLIEARLEVQRRRDQAKRDGDISLHEQLQAEQVALKTAASAMAYSSS